MFGARNPEIAHRSHRPFRTDLFASPRPCHSRRDQYCVTDDSSTPPRQGYDGDDRESTTTTITTTTTTTTNYGTASTMAAALARAGATIALFATAIAAEVAHVSDDCEWFDSWQIAKMPAETSVDVPPPLPNSQVSSSWRVDAVMVDATLYPLGASNKTSFALRSPRGQVATLMEVGSLPTNVVSLDGLKFTLANAATTTSTSVGDVGVSVAGLVPSVQSFDVLETKNRTGTWTLVGFSGVDGATIDGWSLRLCTSRDSTDSTDGAEEEKFLLPRMKDSIAKHTVLFGVDDDLARIPSNDELLDRLNSAKAAMGDVATNTTAAVKSDEEEEEEPKQEEEKQVGADEASDEPATPNAGGGWGAVLAAAAHDIRAQSPVDARKSVAQAASTVAAMEALPFLGKIGAVMYDEKFKTLEAVGKLG